ncbi:transcription factor IIA, alpha/beta subunit-domain-containing protein [Mycena rosella]|uniref:Transcription factor IIA, alpha/beta subunit-domain-containing protein n=1 Tax=Mycena rosella TaxID=1033263 RepID=A0AAD7GXL8_MYCRO|nr:transcription factor IIA, alpha/beta subunit-domain-containing protein [Mycena rosella]
MSNKIVPAVYRSVIDEVITAIRPAFEEFGLADEVLHELQHKWETKVIASRVAEFDPGPPAQRLHPHPPPAVAAAAATALPHYAAYVPPSAARAPTPAVKTEPAPDPRYPSYALPALLGPQFPGFPASLGHAGMYRVPQTDGPAHSESDEDDSDGGGGVFAPRTAHPSLPQPKAKPSAAEPVDDEAINSDLDDSDTENEEDPDDAGPETDIVFCTYDKVARVKNKWKCVLKDGMIHTNGRDYLFGRCTGEFEW